MIYIRMSKDGSVIADPMIADVSAQGVVETIKFIYPEIEGTLRQINYTDDFGEVKTKLLACDDTATVEAYMSSCLRIKLQYIMPLTGAVVFESKQVIISLRGLNKTTCGCHHNCSQGYTPSSDQLYSLMTTIKNDVDNEIKMRKELEAATAARLDSVKELINTVDDNYEAFKSTCEAKLLELDKAIEGHVGDLSNPHKVTKDQVGLSNVDNTSDYDKPLSAKTVAALSELTDSINDIKDRLDILYKESQKRDIGYANVEELVAGVTVKLTCTYLGDDSSNSYKYALEREDSNDKKMQQVLSWEREDEDAASIITAAKTLINADGNYFSVYRKSDDKLVCRAEIEPRLDINMLYFRA